MNGTSYLIGKVTAKKISRPDARIYKIKNHARWGFVKGWLEVSIAKLVSKLFNTATITSELRGTLIHAGQEYDLGVLSYRKVTDNGVQFITDAWRNTVELEIMKYHGCGTGTTAEATADTALVTESTTALNPDSTRATGTLAGSGATFTSVGTATFDATAAITEHGLFSQSATGGGTLFDRSVFSAINVVSGDSIQFTYTVTLTSGG